MINKEYELIIPFITYPWKKYTLGQIKNLLKKKSYSYVYNSLKNFVKQGILNQEIAGNVILYSLNTESLKAQSYAGLSAEHVAWNKKHLPFKDLEKIANKIPTNFYIMIITGSYAKNKQTEKSDIDMVIVVDNSMETKRVYAELKLYCELNIPPIHLYVFKESEFLEMLLNNEANYGKEIALNNLILHGGQIYYKILAEAIKNGFNDKKLS